VVIVSRHEVRLVVGTRLVGECSTRRAAYFWVYADILDRRLFGIVRWPQPSSYTLPQHILESRLMQIEARSAYHYTATRSSQPHVSSPTSACCQANVSMGRMACIVHAPPFAIRIDWRRE
jgi:hypothetical protein